MVSTNCWFAVNRPLKKAVIVDPADNFIKIKNQCELLEISPAAVLLTHGHFDHAMAAAELENFYKIPVYAAEAEKELLSDAGMNGSRMIGKKLCFSASVWLNDGDVIEEAQIKLKTIATAGHTAGSVCYFAENNGFVFTGDTLFYRGIGRTDLPTGNHAALIESIKNKLFTLPNNTAVYPGHGPETTISGEKNG